MVYNFDLKKRVVENFLSKNTNTKETIKLFDISNGSLFNWVYLRKVDRLEEKRKRRSKFTDEMKAYIKKYIIKRTNFKYQKLIDSIWKIYKIKMSKSSLYKIIKEMDLTKKKINKRFIFTNKKKRNQQIKEFKNKLKKKSIKDIISIDESSFDTHISHNYGWSEKGTKITIIKKEKYIRYTIICAIDSQKVIHIKIIKGSADKFIFLDFMKELVAKINANQNYCILLDGARIHHAIIFQKFMEEQENLELVYNVPYSPEFNPIEKVFNEAKGKIKGYKLTNANFINNISRCFRNISSENLTNYYNKSLEFIEKVQ